MHCERHHGKGRGIEVDHIAHKPYIGYSTESKGYRFYDPENNKLVESRDAIFLDHQTPRRTKRARVELLATPDEPHFDTSRINTLDEENITPEGNINQIHFRNIK
jgi:hypothetical protein